MDALDLHRVEAKAFPYNTLSINALLRNGFREEGILREAHVRNGQRWDILVFSILRGGDGAAAREGAVPLHGVLARGVMSVHKLLPLFALILNVLLLSSALVGERRSRPHRVFAGLTTALAVWNLGVFGLRSSLDQDDRSRVGALPSPWGHPDPRPLLPLRARLPRGTPRPDPVGGYALCGALPPREPDPDVHARGERDVLGLRAASPARSTRRSSSTSRRTWCSAWCGSCAPTRSLDLPAEPHAARDRGGGGEPHRRSRGLRPVRLRLGRALSARHPVQRVLRPRPRAHDRPVPAPRPRTGGALGAPLRS